MATSVDGVRAYRANRALLPVLGLFAGGLALSALYSRTGIGVPCPFRPMTGWDCPLCGSTRMGAALLDGHLGEAFAWNPAVLLVLAALAVLTVRWSIPSLTRPPVRRPRPLVVWLRRISPGRWLLISVAVAAVYTVLRNVF